MLFGEIVMKRSLPGARQRPTNRLDGCTGATEPSSGLCEAAPVLGTQGLRGLAPAELTEDI